MRHRYFNKHLRRTLMAAAIGAPGLLFAGNIPQYTVSKGTNKYAEFSDGIIVKDVRFNGDEVVYANGVQSANSRTGDAFDLGFDFRFGGQTFNSFVFENTGALYLGREGSVTFVGSPNGTNFSISMAPIMWGLQSATFSYKTTGEEGDRVFIFQVKDALLDDPNSSWDSKYSEQIRLYEKDGKIEIAFTEVDTYHSGNNFGFATGLHGWNGSDALYLTGMGIDKEISVSSSLPNMLEGNTYLHWDGDDYMKIKQPVFVFTPCMDTDAPAVAPSNLVAAQLGNNLKVSCEKAQEADATIVMYSQSPFTENDFPKDGETFLAGAAFGNAVSLYYGSDSKIEVEIPNIESDAKYYITAFSANGYPAYAIDNRVSKVFATAQSAPTEFVATTSQVNGIGLSWQCNYPVIIAKTTTQNPAYQSGYCGVFGTPSADAKVGDILEGGGEIVYVGNASEFTLDAAPNTLTFFRAWSVNEGQLSATSTDAFGITAPLFPYEPGLEKYPFGEQLQVWSADQDQFIPWKREYMNDAALRAVSVEGAEVSLSTPPMDITTPMRVSFEYSLETILPPDDKGVPQGNKAGVFGNGSLQVVANGESYKSISEYNGTMKACPDGFETGSSTYDEVTVDIPALGTDQIITIKFNTESTSYLYLRNIKIERTAEEPKAPILAPTGVVADEDKSANLHFSCKKGEDAEYTLVLFSEKPITESDYPQDGVIPAVGSTSGNATVLYYGDDENVECVTNYDIVIADYNTTYYFAALSASANPLYNRENVAKVEYTTMKEAGKPSIDEPDFDGTNLLLTIKGNRHADAASTIVLISEDKFNGNLEDGHQYTHGEEVGNAKVIYHGTDDTINHQTNLVEANKTYTLTAISANERGWWADSQATHVFTTNATGVESIGTDASDLSNAEIYNVMGVRINVSCIEELPQGIYIINGKKINKHQ